MAPEAVSEILKWAWREWVDDNNDDRSVEEAFYAGWEMGQKELAERNEADRARKRASKIRESYLSSVRANVNLLASMTATERYATLAPGWPKPGAIDPDKYARAKARALMVETWGEDAVAAALGGDASARAVLQEIGE